MFVLECLVFSIVILFMPNLLSNVFLLLIVKIQPSKTNKLIIAIRLLQLQKQYFKAKA